MGKSSCLLRFYEVSPSDHKSLHLLVFNKMVKEGKGVFEWKDLGGKTRQIFIKKNRSFIDRKHAQLMFQLYKKLRGTIQ